MLLLAGGCVTDIYNSYDWNPDDDSDYVDAAGSWHGMRNDRANLTLVLRQRGSSVSGMIEDSQWGTLLVSGHVRGDNLMLTAEDATAITLSGRVDGDRIHGTSNHGKDGMGHWWARRRDDE